jgi:RNA polymerase sigma-70 factor (ECF subfamily)
MSRIVINTSIDHYRKRIKTKTVDLDNVYHLKTREPSVVQSMSAEEIIKAMHQLTTMYRTIFNMFVVEGYSHKEIALKLRISESTSRSNLVKARKKLKEILLSKDKFYDQ